MQQVREAVDTHESVVVFSYENMRSAKFKNVRLHFRDDGSRIFMGKNKLLQIALGRTDEEEYADNLRHVSKLLRGGAVGLLFTNRGTQEVQDYFKQTVEADYARAGSVASRQVDITADSLKPFPSSMMEPFRKLGLPVEIKNGVITFRDGIDTYRICKEGETLSAEKCKLLVHFGFPISNFQVSIMARWSKGEFEPL